MSPRFVFGAMALAIVLGPACGGGGATQPAAKTGKSGADGTEKSDGSEARGDGESAAPAASRCADGTCFECGAGLCPKGFYCDEKASGGAACAWLPECAQSATCACVEKALGSGCSCSEKAGGVSVSCQGR
ncbi:MAG: hypothetical protein HYZ29_01910 [Myxococcales bacterium]|nr:hypothetical protein [Myxococcales bacterium]